MPDFKFDDMLKDAFNANAKRGKGAEESAKALQFAGLAQVFQHIAETGPGLLQLQQALLHGARANQAQEAQRIQQQLENLNDAVANDNAVAFNAQLLNQIKTLEERQVRYGTQAEYLELATRYAKTLLKTSQQTGSFHGYVVNATGKPAANHIVIINQNPALSAKTNQDGYFVIALNDKNQNDNKQTEATRSEMIANNTLNANSNPENFVTNPMSKSIVVEVQNEQKEVVFTDPFPPLFERSDNIFRLYAIQKTN